MPVLERLAERCIGGDPTNPQASTAGATEYLTGAAAFANVTDTSYATSVDEIDFGSPGASGGGPGVASPVHHNLWIYCQVSSITGANGVTLNLVSDDNTAHTTPTTVVAGKTLTANGFYNWPFGHIAERYGFFQLISGATSTAVVIAGISDHGDSKFIP